MVLISSSTISVFEGALKSSQFILSAFIYFFQQIGLSQMASQGTWDPQTNERETKRRRRHGRGAARSRHPYFSRKGVIFYPGKNKQHTIPGILGTELVFKDYLQLQANFSHWSYFQSQGRPPQNHIVINLFYILNLLKLMYLYFNNRKSKMTTSHRIAARTTGRQWLSNPIIGKAWM